MYYKIMNQNKVVDILDRITYIKYQPKHGILLLSGIEDAEAILSSDGTCGWHLDGLCSYWPDPVTYALEQISRYEYDRLKQFNLKTREQIEDALVLELMEREIL